MYAETIICKLYEARTDLGLTQQQVADDAGIPSLLYAMKLANFLNIPVDQLFEYQSADHRSNNNS